MYTFFKQLEWKFFCTRTFIYNGFKFYTKAYSHELTAISSSLTITLVKLKWKTFIFCNHVAHPNVSSYCYCIVFFLFAELVNTYFFKLFVIYVIAFGTLRLDNCFCDSYPFTFMILQFDTHLFDMLLANYLSSLGINRTIWPHTSVSF